MESRVETGEVEEAAPIGTRHRGWPLLYPATLDMDRRRHLPGISDNALVIAYLVGAKEHVRRRIEEKIELVHHTADRLGEEAHPLIETIHRSSRIF
jgi:hypothetical protein